MPGIQQAEVSILLGMDFYWSLVNDQVLPIRRGELVAVSTRIGWILSGSYPAGQSDHHKGSIKQVALVNLTHNDDQLQQFWSLEAIGIKDDTGNELTDNSIYRDFVNTLEYSPSKRAYKLRLP